jgi:hypothetical protein
MAEALMTCLPFGSGGLAARRRAACIVYANRTAPSFDLVLDLGGDGHVEEAMVRPETKLTTCFLALVKKDSFPPPPSAGFGCRCR